ncbi:MAG TPA: VCBS repeat-containing protein, partial [Candidatus Eisenbacteria bacterium]|nr:VCBS repeat-containing protein [Candidatus Eisenbacteria bacterium]
MEVARRGLAYLLLALGVCSISPTGASGAWNPLFRGAQLLDVGHWTASSAYRAGGPNGLAAGDLNADGRPDLVVVNRNDSIPPQVGKTVSVLLHSSDSNASSPFLPKVNYPTLNKPCAVELADMNLDGALDAVVRTGGDLYVGEADSVCVMLGTGTGSFGPPVSGTNLAIRNSEWWGRGLVLADVNQDGWTDVLAPGSDSSGEPKIAVLLGSAAGLTTLVLHAATPPSPYATNGMAVGDLTGDFILDVVAVGSFGATLLQGNGSGGFSYVKHLLPGGDEVLHAVIVDLNGDDLMDVVLSQSGAAGPHILSFVATGGGNFLAPESYSLGALDAFELGDLDLDGKLDLVATGISDPWVRVLRGDGDGTFQEDDDLYAPAHQWTGDLRLVDVNGNGRLDLVGASPYPLDNRLHTISLILDDGAGGFSEPQITPFSSSVFYQALADFDKNGTLDVAVAKSSGIGIGLGQGDGTFVEVPGGPASGASTIVTGDWNWDGRPDIAFQSGTSIEFHYTLYTFGFLNFTPAFGMPGQTLHRRSVADMNRDGRPDLVVTDVNVVRVHTQNEDGTYFPNAPQNVIGDVRSLAPGDWNRDGITDVVVTTTSGALLLLGNGDGTLGPPKLVSPASRIYADLCIGDFNRDGRPDLAMLEAKCGQSGTRGIDVLLGDGAGGFLGAPSVPTLEQNGYRLESWDVNVDGYPDLVASGLPDPALDPWPFDDPPPASVEVHLGEGTGRFDPPLAYSLGQPHSSSSNPTPHFAVGDVNRDGEPDIVSVHDVSVRSLLETPPDFGNALGPRVDYPTSAGTRRIAAGDLNRDGILDVVTASTSNLASVRLGTRPGTLGPATTVTQSFAALEVDLADVNRDGKLDLLCVGTTEVLTCML